MFFRGSQPVLKTSAALAGAALAGVAIAFLAPTRRTRCRLYVTVVGKKASISNAAVDVPLQEDKPSVVLDQGGALICAWKPAKMSMRRQLGGMPSEFEAWVLSGAGSAKSGLVPAAVPQLGRGVAGLVLLGRQSEALLGAEAALLAGSRAGTEASIAAVVQGEPSAETVAEAACEDVEGLPIDLKVLRASEGLRFGRLSIVSVSPLPCGASLPAGKEVRRRLAALGHRVIGNGNLCARAAGVTRTYLALVRLGLRVGDGDFVAEVPPPLSFHRFLDADALRLQRKGAGPDWGGRTEHCEGVVRFDGLDLRVPPGVFVPRRSALHVVEAAAELPLPAAPRLLDAGTGSGCILLSLLQRLQGATGIGIDADPAAVAAASHNAGQLLLGDRAHVQLLQFSQIGELAKRGPFHLALSNPPYLAERVVQHVGFARELQTQSVAAFAAGQDGLQAYIELAASLAEPGVLAPSAWVVMGCQPGRASLAAGPFTATGQFKVHAEKEQCAVLQFLG